MGFAVGLTNSTKAITTRLRASLFSVRERKKWEIIESIFMRLGDYICIYSERNRYKRWKVYLRLCVLCVSSTEWLSCELHKWMRICRSLSAFLFSLYFAFFISQLIVSEFF